MKPVVASPVVAMLSMMITGNTHGAPAGMRPSSQAPSGTVVDAMARKKTVRQARFLSMMRPMMGASTTPISPAGMRVRPRTNRAFEPSWKA